MLSKVLEITFHKCDNDLDTAIMRLNEPCLGAGGGNSSAEEPEVVVNVGEGKLEDDGNAFASGNRPAFNNLPANGAKWLLEILLANFLYVNPGEQSMERSLEEERFLFGITIPICSFI